MKVAPPPNFEDLIATVPAKRAMEIILNFDLKAEPYLYLHWDKLRYKKPPKGLTVKEWWLGIKTSRRALYKPIAHCDQAGRPFVYAKPAPVQRLLHELDIRIGPGLQSIDQDSELGQYNLINSLIEEAITSSQLEGASTTRQVAKEVLKQGKKPTDVSERMIVNNYLAIQFVLEVKDEALTPEIVLKIHRMITEDTDVPVESVGKLRRSDDIFVSDPTGQTEYYPPPSSELKERMDSLCEFANRQTKKEFVHPIIRAIILHFLLAYDHPFADGNGRTARALFYWSLLRDGYEVMQYLPISRRLKAAPAQYGKAFLHTETDDSDMTYFIIHQLGVMRKALDDTRDYLKKKKAELAEVDARIGGGKLNNKLNNRQRALLGRAMYKPDAIFTVESHRHSHDVAYQTARVDLLELEQHGLLTKHKQGKEFVFVPAKNIRQKLRKIA